MASLNLNDTPSDIIGVLKPHNMAYLYGNLSDIMDILQHRMARLNVQTRLNDTISETTNILQPKAMASLNATLSDIIINALIISWAIILLFLIPFIVYHIICSKTYLLNRITALESILQTLQSSQSIQLYEKSNTRINDSHIHDTEDQIMFLKAVMGLSRFARIGVSVCYGLCRLLQCSSYDEKWGGRVKLMLNEMNTEGQYAGTMERGGDVEDLEKGVYGLWT